MNLQDALGALVLAVAAAVGVLGGFSVRNSCLRRLERPKPLIFDFSGHFQTMWQFDAGERRRLLVYGVIAAVLGLLGMALLQGAFGPSP